MAGFIATPCLLMPQPGCNDRNQCTCWLLKAPAACLRHAGSRLRHLSCASAALEVTPPLLFNTIHPLDGGWHDKYETQACDLKLSRMWGRSREQSRDRLKASYHSPAKWTAPLIVDIHLVLAFLQSVSGDDSILRKDRSRTVQHVTPVLMAPST